MSSAPRSPPSSPPPAVPSYLNDDDDYSDDDLPSSSVTPPPLPYPDIDDIDDPDVDFDKDGDDDDVDDDDDDDDGSGDDGGEDSGADSSAGDDFLRRRMDTHARLRSYESKRRDAYESKLQSSGLYWRAFRTLMHDSLLETQRAHLLVRGWTHASASYRDAMASVGGWCVDDKGVPIVDHKKKKKFLDMQAASASAGGVDSSSAGEAVLLAAGGGHHRRGTSSSSSSSSSSSISGSASVVVADFYRGEKCGSVVQGFADTASSVAGRYDEMVKVMNADVLPELSS